MNTKALIIIAKRPENGKVKTRLNGFLSRDKILRLYTYLLDHTVEKFRKIPGVTTFIAFAPESAGEYFSRFNLRTIPLVWSDLGTTMFHAFREVFNAGYKKTVLVGADIPDLSVPTILKAFDLLSDNDLVYGPAEDGGYYLIGMTKLIREVFDAVPWSSGETLKKSLEQAHRSGYSTALTDTLSDIDTIEDVKKSGLLI